MEKVKQIVSLVCLMVVLTGCQQSIGQTQSISSVGGGANQTAVVKNAKKAEDQFVNPEGKINKHSGQMQVHYINAGQADATLFEFEEREKKYAVLYDTGDWDRKDVVQYLQKERIDKLDLVIISHPDSDHIGQLVDIIQEIPVEEVWMSGNTSTSDTFREALRAVDDHNIGYYEPRIGEKFDVGPLAITILYPEELTGHANDDSISLLASYGETDFLFTGDAGKASERKMITSGNPLKAEVLSLGHHGSNTASSPEFIDAVDPDIAIYSAGKGNSYGHPHKEVVDLMREKEIPLYGTDKDGTILVTTDGIDYEVAVEKTRQRSSHDNRLSKNKKEANKQSAGNVEQIQKDQKINLNSASAEELQAIIHIGSERAKSIIEKRPFQSLDGLLQLDGIGPSRLKEIKEEGKAMIEGGH
ncbi:MAG: MBL fold metallo-hydrolase [Pisciglobus halotolerans]|nr:MBL fold metallo-hydrolase [Pisciglobus halotolerans]